VHLPVQFYCCSRPPSPAFLYHALPQHCRHSLPCRMHIATSTLPTPALLPSLPPAAQGMPYLFCTPRRSGNAPLFLLPGGGITCARRYHAHL